MARDGNGTYSLPAGNPVVSGATISSVTHNTTMSDIASALTQSLSKDGQTAPTANLQMAGYKFTSVGDATARDQYASAGQVQDGALTYLSSVSGTDTITATSSPAITAYATGQIFRFVAAGANTGAVTLNINSLGAKSITKNGSTALAAGDIASGSIALVSYDGTRFQLLGMIGDANLMHLAGTETVTGDKTYSGSSTFSGSVQLYSADAGASVAPSLELYRDSASPAASDVLGELRFSGKDSGGNKTGYGVIYLSLSDPTNGSEDGAITIQTIVAGTLASRWLIGAGLYYSGGTDPGAGQINATGYLVSGNASGPATSAEVEAATNAYVWVSPATQQKHPSAAKAWVRFVGSGTVTISSSHNVSSITDNGTGDYTINITADSFDDSGYCVLLSSNTTGGNNVGVFGVASNTTSTCRITGGSVGTSGTVPQDRDVVYAGFFGDT